MKVLKFGGKSLANGEGIQSVISILLNKIQNKQEMVIVVSARGTATDDLLDLLESAKKGEDYQVAFEIFKNYQKEPLPTIDFSEEFTFLEKIFEGVHLLEDYSPKIKDLVTAYGELLSGKMITALLVNQNINAQYTDSRSLFKTDNVYGAATLLEEITEENAKKYFSSINLSTTIPVVTGFVGASLDGETTTIGLNGSNYSASLIAGYLNAEELENYTIVSGIYTANPNLVSNAQKINHLSFNEANELANLGDNVLDAKAIIPLVKKNISLRILNTFEPESQGTLINAEQTSKNGIRAISVQENMALVSLEGRGLLGKVGIDARLFTALQKENVSVGIISQGSSERGISFVVSGTDAHKAKDALGNEFNLDFLSNDINKITITRGVAVVSILGNSLSSFKTSYTALVNNNIKPLLINNTVTGNNVCLVIDNKELRKAVNVMHGEIFGIAKKINVAVFGVGLVGGTLIKQILESKKNILKRKGIDLNVFAVANSKKVYFNADGIEKTWKQDLKENGIPYKGIEAIVKYAKENHLGNLIAVDNSASAGMTENYIPLIENGFNLVSSNKIGNTKSLAFYNDLRLALLQNRKQYLYETNVGAGLPLIDTIKLMHASGENITRIKGVFSGTLSYLFNNFSAKDVQFSEVLNQAAEQGFTEPDPREDLNGNDVGRKLLILARELDLENEFEDVQIHNLIPEPLREGDTASFLSQLTELDPVYQEIKDKQEPNHVLRYIGDLHGDLASDKGVLEVKLVSVPSNSALGQVKGADSIFEIYTESYGDQPVVIQGAGAGANVTARGVFGDIMRLTDLEL
ncbi:aspartokinase/homoserine dehydrogenase 1 [Wenyingzhuangia heitensis]|uniref:Aspartokinase/homoserine dehydrogenase 1 n=1 Tax=Wenyingzhuangia heitensis TaxID=1487859 RepID=A0ABX0U695_9FLAO|nr:bifunctional aspartate kinase/homoserine dehydrogenase I [Wenyingzhuangia heitensis]NIJ44368.1 aspartokinase/homoserine dehydrogenase 1 [Wenyingzhuangia heitensis]